jgi:hypothetical protein
MLECANARGNTLAAAKEPYQRHNSPDGFLPISKLCPRTDTLLLCLSYDPHVYGDLYLTDAGR